MLAGLPVDEISSAWDLFVTCQLFADGEPLCLPEGTSRHGLVGRPAWNEWLTLPITVDALPQSTVAIFTVWDVGPVALGSTTIPVFSETSGKLRKGRKKMLLWLNQAGDPSDGTTPWDAAELDESDRLQHCLVRYEKQKTSRIGWLDALSFAEIRARQAKHAQLLRPDVAFLNVEFPVFLHSVLFHQKEFVTTTNDCAKNSIVKGGESFCFFLLVLLLKFVSVFDPEISQSNPVEDRFMRMHRVQLGLDASLKLTNSEKKDLARIVDYSTTKQLSDADKNKVWMSRLYLRSIVAALPKFVVRNFFFCFVFVFCDAAAKS